MQSAKLTSTQWRGDTGGFPVRGRFNKLRKTNTVCAVTGLPRGEDGGTLDTSSCRKEAELWKKANRSHERVSLTPPWTCDLTFRLLPITSARHLAHIPQSAHAHAALCAAAGKGWRRAARAAACWSRRGQKNENHRSQGNYKKTWTLDAPCHSQPGEKYYPVAHGPQGFFSLQKLTHVKLEIFSFYFLFCLFLNDSSQMINQN